MAGTEGAVMTDAEAFSVNRPMAHDSAALHVSGEALYVDDIATPANTLHAAIGQSIEPYAELISLDLAAVRAAPGVVAMLTAKDIPGINDVGPVYPGDPLLADGLIEYAGQALNHRAGEASGTPGES